MNKDGKPMGKIAEKARNLSMIAKPIPEELKGTLTPQFTLETSERGNLGLEKKGLETRPTPQELRPAPQPSQGNGNSQNAGTSQQGNTNTEPAKK